MADKLTTVSTGGDDSVGYYVNGKLFAEIHCNDFDSEIEPVYRGIMREFNVKEFENLYMTDSDYEKYSDNGWEHFEDLSEYELQKEDE